MGKKPTDWRQDILTEIDFMAAELAANEKERIFAEIMATEEGRKDYAEGLEAELKSRGYTAGVRNWIIKRVLKDYT